MTRSDAVTLRPRDELDDVRAVVQRVSEARVRIDGEVVGQIGSGLCVLVGATHADTAATSRSMASKLWHLRIFDDGSGAMNDPVARVGGQVLVVSQFTLYGDTRRGRRPSWAAAAPAVEAEPRIDEVIAELRRLGATVATGRFRAHMQVEIVNDGPVTLVLEA